MEVLILDAETAKTGAASSEGGDPLELSAADKEAVEGDRSSSVSSGADSEVSQEQTIDENIGETTFNYEQLKAKSTTPVRGIDYKRREVCPFAWF